MLPHMLLPASSATVGWCVWDRVESNHSSSTLQVVLLTPSSRAGWLAGSELGVLSPTTRRACCHKPVTDERTVLVLLLLLGDMTAARGQASQVVRAAPCHAGKGSGCRRMPFA